MTSGASKRFKAVYELMKKKQYNTFGWSSKMDLKNFVIREYKPSGNKLQIKPYPYIRDKLVHIALPANSQVGSNQAIRVPIPGLRWIKAGEDEMIRFLTNKAEAVQVLKKIKSGGIEITNLKQLEKDFNRLKLLKRSASKNSDD
jgi:hypothetical protein